MSRPLRRFRGPVALLVAAVAAFVLGPGNAMGAFTRTVTNTTDTAAVNFSCTAAAVAAGAYLTYPFAENIGLSAADVSGNARTGTYTLLGVTYGGTGPCPRDGGKAVTLDGLTGYAYYGTQVTNPQTFTEEVWFNTSTTLGGKLIGFGNNATGASSNYDRHIYMTSGAAGTGGKLIFGVYPGAVKTVQSTAAYNDGKWHLATASLAASGPQAGMRLYVDGVLVASDTTVTSAQVFNGYWRVGYDNLANWTTPPTSSYLAGKVAYAQVYTTALTPTQIQGQYTAGTP